MILNLSGGSGGAALNFEVVGGKTQPANPKENTIWVDTEVPIPGYRFCADAPFAGSIVEAAGTVFGTMNGRVYSKTNGGRAAWAWAYDGSYSGCLLVSEDQNAASYSTSGNYDSVQTAGQTFVYNGKTYYYTTGAWFAGDCTSGLNPVVKGSSIQEVLEVLAKTYEAAEGMVWFKTGASSSADFNALKKNGVQVYPICTYQWNGGVWSDKTSTIYQNGAWKYWSAFLYNGGDECTSLTGGWEALAWKINSSNTRAGLPTVTKTGSSMTIVGNSGSQYYSGIVKTVKKVDLSQYSTLEFTGYIYGHATYGYQMLCIWSEMDGNGWQNNVVASIGGSDKTIKTTSIDISSLTGEYYIGFGLYGDDPVPEIVMTKIELKG